MKIFTSCILLIASLSWASEYPIETLSYGVFPPKFYWGPHHFIHAIHVDKAANYSIELKDGSIWKISKYDENKLINWKKSSSLIITQNFRFFSEYDYLIINQDEKISVEANLSSGSFLEGELSRFITEIDQNEMKLTLNDHTRWAIEDLDRQVFKGWTPGEFLIIGTNSDISFLDSSHHALLINVNMNQRIRAKQLPEIR